MEKIKRMNLEANREFEEVERLHEEGRLLRIAPSREVQVSRLERDMEKLGERQITIDCDVLQADGGTRCAAITGGMVALELAVKKLMKEKVVAENPLVCRVAAVSVGVCGGIPTLDLDYVHDSTAEVDLNVVMTDDGRFVELQGCAEHKPFSDRHLAAMLKLAKSGLGRIFASIR